MLAVSVAVEEDVGVAREELVVACRVFVVVDEAVGDEDVEFEYGRTPDAEPETVEADEVTVDELYEYTVTVDVELKNTADDVEVPLPATLLDDDDDDDGTTYTTKPKTTIFAEPPLHAEVSVGYVAEAYVHR